MLVSMLPFDSLRSLGSESSMGFLGTGGAGFRAIPELDEAIDALLEALGFCPRSLAVPPTLRLLSNEILACGLNGRGSMRVGPVSPVDTTFGALCRVPLSIEVWVRLSSGTTTQSCSLVGLKGFEGLEVLRTEFFSGGPTFDRTGKPLKDCQILDSS